MRLSGLELSWIGARRRPVARWVLLLSIIGGISFSTMVGQSPAAAVPEDGRAPQWVCDEPVHEFEAVWSGERVKHSFVFRNEGNDTLRILNVRAGCRCTATSDYTREVAPGGEGQIPVVLDTRGMRRETTRSIRVETNDPGNNNVTLTLKGPIKTALEYPSGQNVDFGRIHSGSELIKTVRLVNQTEQPMKIEPAEGKSGVFAWRIKEIEPGKVADVFVTALPPFADGPNHTSLRLRTGLEKEPDALISCRLQNPPVVECAPDRLIFNPGTSRAHSREIFVRYNGEGAMNLLSVEAENPDIKTEVNVVQAGKSYNLKIHFPADLNIHPSRPTHLILKTDLEEHSKVRIPIRSHRAAVTAAQRRGREKPWSLVGQRVPRITLPDLDGNDVDIGGDGGKVSVLNFGSTWCIFANLALRDWRPVFDPDQDRQIQFYNIVTDVLTPVPEVTEWMDGLRVSADTVLDQDLKAVELFGISRLPTLILIGRNGTVEAVRQGFLPDQAETIGNELKLLAEGKTHTDFRQADHRIGQFCAVSLVGRQTRPQVPLGFALESFRVFAGWQPAGQPFNCRIYYRNEGDSPVRITGVEAPDGVEIDPDYTKELQPKEVGVIKCVMTPPKEATGEFTRRLIINVDDPRRPKQMVLLSGLITTLVSIDPEQGLDFVQDPRNPLTIRPATLTYNGPGPIQYGPVTCDSPNFEGRIESSSAGRQARLIVETKPPYAVGMTESLVRVQTDHKDLPVIEVPVRLYVPPPVEIIPARIEMIRGDEEREAMILIANNTEDDLRIVGAETSNEQIKVQYFPEDDGAFYRVELTFAEGFISARDGEKVVVKTSNRQIGDIVIPIIVKDVNHKG